VDRHGKFVSPALAALLLAAAAPIFISGCAGGGMLALATMSSIVDVDKALELPKDHELYFGFVEPNTRLEDYACLSFNSRWDAVVREMFGKKIPFTENIIVPAGKYTLQLDYSNVRYDPPPNTPSPTALEHVFEPGKFYVIDFRLSKAGGRGIAAAFIEESGAPDAKLLEDWAKVKAFLDSGNFSSEGIDGVYSLETESQITKT
jgi:hypothetical protein